MARPVLSVTVGPARVGKTARVVRLLITQFLPFENGRLFTNLPLFPEKIADIVGPILAARMGYKDPQMGRAEVLRRIIVIPPEVLNSWECGDGAGECPGRWFEGRIQPGDHIMLDEAHRYIPQEADKRFPALVQEWRNWVGELGHPGGSLELVSQGQWKFSERIRDEASTKFQLTPLNEEEDPMTGFKVGDQWQFMGKLTGHYQGGWREDVWERRNNKFEVVLTDGRPFNIYRFEQKWFGCYDSQARRPGEEGGYERAKLPFEMLSWPWFLSWFIGRNLNPVIKYVSYPTMAAAVLFFAFFWGRSTLMGGMALLNNAFRGTPSAVALADGAPTGPQSASLSPLSSSRSSVSGQQLSDSVGREVVDKLNWESAIVLLSEKHLIFASGVMVRVGSKVEHGAYAGKTLKRIDFTRRVAQLDDGTVLLLGRQKAVAPASPVDKIKAAVSRDSGKAKGDAAGKKPAGGGPAARAAGGLATGQSSGEFLPTLAPVPEPEGTGGGAGSRPQSEATGGGLGVRGAGGQGSGKSGASMRSESDRIDNPSSGGTDSQTADQVRNGNPANYSGGLTPAARVPKRAP